MPDKPVVDVRTYTIRPREPTIATLLGHKPTGAVPACASRVAVQRADTDSSIAHLDVWTMAA
jgi:hypothetical protein